MLTHPGLDSRISRERVGEPEKLVDGHIIPVPNGKNRSLNSLVLLRRKAAAERMALAGNASVECDIEVRCGTFDIPYTKHDVSVF